MSEEDPSNSDEPQQSAGATGGGAGETDHTNTGDGEGDDPCPQPTATSTAINWASVAATIEPHLKRGRRFRSTPRTDGPCAGRSRQDIVHDAMALVLGEPNQPTTHDEACQRALVHALRIWRQHLQTERERARNLKLRHENDKPTPDELATALSRQAENNQIIALCLERLDGSPDAKLILYLVLKKGFPWRKTSLLAKEIGLNVATVENLKRRIKRTLERIDRDSPPDRD